MAERLVVTQPFTNKAEAARFVTALMAQMNSVGFSAEPAPSSGGIGTDTIGLNIDDPVQDINTGNVQIIIYNNCMSIVAPGNNPFAKRSIEAVARGLGLSPEEATNLVSATEIHELDSGGATMIAIIPDTNIAT